MKALKQELKYAHGGFDMKTYAKGTPLDELPMDAAQHAKHFDMLEEVKAAKSSEGGDDDKSLEGGTDDKSVKPNKKK